MVVVHDDFRVLIVIGGGGDEFVVVKVVVKMVVIVLVVMFVQIHLVGFPMSEYHRLITIVCIIQ